jgi:hypothetical protein
MVFVFSLVPKKGGEGFMALTVEFEAFFVWLCSHRDGEIVGVSGRCFDSPLARFLSVQAGRLIGVDGLRYGWALANVWRQPLPFWAQVFSSLCEGRIGATLTASEAVDLLVEVEMILSPIESFAA